MEQNYEYYAFISYKHEDEKWAKWLHRKLEGYRLPSAVCKEIPRLPKRVKPIFRDKTDLGPGELTANIHSEMERSRYLIVICSPKSAQSEWVGKEIAYFKELGRYEQIIPFIVDGEPNSDNPSVECFNPALKEEDKELLGINIFEIGKEQAFIKVVARLLDIRFDALWGRERRRQRRNLIIRSIIYSVSILVVVLMYLLTNLSTAISIADNAYIRMKNGDAFNAVLMNKFIENNKTMCFMKGLLKRQLSDMPLSYLSKEVNLFASNLPVGQSYIMGNYNGSPGQGIFYSSDSDKLISISQDSLFTIWDSENLKFLSSYKFEYKIGPIALKNKTTEAVILTDNCLVTTDFIGKPIEYPQTAIIDGQYQQLIIDNYDKYGAILTMDYDLPNEIANNFKAYPFDLKTFQHIDCKSCYASSYSKNGNYISYNKDNTILINNLINSQKYEKQSPIILKGDEIPIYINIVQDIIFIITNQRHCFSIDINQDKTLSYTINFDFKIVAASNNKHTIVISSPSKILSLDITTMEVNFEVENNNNGVHFFESQENALVVYYNSGVSIINPQTGEWICNYCGDANCFLSGIDIKDDRLAMINNRGYISLYKTKCNYIDSIKPLPANLKDKVIIDISNDGQLICYKDRLNVCVYDIEKGQNIYNECTYINSDNIQFDIDKQSLYQITRDMIYKLNFDSNEEVITYYTFLDEIDRICHVENSNIIALVSKPKESDVDFYTSVYLLDKNTLDRISTHTLLGVVKTVAVDVDNEIIYFVNDRNVLGSVDIRTNEYKDHYLHNIQNEFVSGMILFESYIDIEEKSVTSLFGNNSILGLTICNSSISTHIPKLNILYRHWFVCNNLASDGFTRMIYDYKNKKIIALTAHGYLCKWNILTKNEAEKFVNSIVKDRCLSWFEAMSLSQGQYFYPI